MPDSIVSSNLRPFNDELVEKILELTEGPTIEFKRVGDNASAIKTSCAFANTEGGWLVLGIEDLKKAKGLDRVFGIQEKPEAVDDLKRQLGGRITPPLVFPNCNPPAFIEIGCTLRDRHKCSIVIVRIEKSNAVHSLVDGGTYVREGRSNRQLNAAEITELSLKRGATSFVSVLVDMPFELLDTVYWKEYRDQRRLTRPIDEALFHLGLAKRDVAGKLQPSRAAVLLFAEEPSGILDSKCATRVFHYKGDTIEHRADTNLMRPPKTIGGPLKVQIAGAREAVLDSLASGVQVGPLGFEIVQKYPVRVLTEAITNAVIHRDYRLPADIHIRIFANRIEVESPGIFPGNVSVNNIGIIGSHPRNRALVDHLREFPNPPNLDAGEGVRMMLHMMDQSNLYPPIFLSQPDIPKEAVIVFLFNELRPSVWDQVHQYLQKHKDIGNAEVRMLLRNDDPTKSSKMLITWVKLGLLVIANPGSAKQYRRYRLPGMTSDQSLFSELLGKQGGTG